jgi:uncharacterized protein YijF (DUF1287 family)
VNIEQNRMAKKSVHSLHRQWQKVSPEAKINHARFANRQCCWAIREVRIKIVDNDTKAGEWVITFDEKRTRVNIRSFDDDF